MITAVFTDNSDYARATGLWQWDYGQRLRIEGLKLPTAVEIHFALTEFAGDAIPRVGTTKDGVTEVVIPDSLLENQAAGATYEIYAWIYLADKTSGETIKRISMQVKCRPKPEAFDAPGDAEIFRDAIAQVNASADRAETAREGAEAAQRAAEEAAGKIEGEITGAGQIAEQVRQDAEAVAKDKQAVSQMVTETTQNARNAASSAQAAESSSTAAKEAQTAAESAGERATSAMEATEKGRTEVAENRKAVEQAKEAVAADRRAVENTALQFGQFAQSAINVVGQAQEAAVGAVSAEGQRQTTAVQNAGTQAVGEVGTAKAEAVQAVTTEGDTQTKRVQDAAAGIVADREQIAANKAGVESLQQNKADAIVETAQGETMTLTDSSDKLFEGLRVFGKSTQAKTTGAQLFDVTNVDMKTILNVDGTTNANGSIHTSGFIKVSPNTTYSVSKTRQNRGKFYNLEKKPLTTDKFDFELSNNGDKFTTLESVEYVRFSIYETVDLNTLMMNQGDTLKPYEPYSGGFPSPSVDWEQPILNAGEGGSITVEVTGRNLLKPNSYGTYYEFPLKANTVITLMTNGKPSQGGNIKFSAIDGSTVWFSIDAGQTRVCRSIGNKDVKGFYDVLNVDGGLEYMFAVGDIKNYAPYVEPQSLTLTTPNGLPGVPVTSDGNYTDKNGQQWICDERDYGRRKYVQRVEVVKANDLTWKADFFGEETNRVYRYSTSAIPDLIDRLNGLSNCFRYRTGSSIKANEFVVEESGRLRVVFETPFESIEALMEWFRQKETVFYLPKSTPIERDLTPEELAAYSSLHTNYPTTVITNDAGAHMESSYVADTGTYIRNMEERLNAKLVNIQSALISQKISGGGIKVTDSSRVPVVRFAMWGKTEQVRTSGKNLIDIPEIKAETGSIEVICNIARNAVFSCRKEDVVITKSIWRVQFKYKNGNSVYLTDDSISSGVVKVTEDNPIVSIVYRGMYIESGRYTDIQLEYGSSPTAYEPYSGGRPSPSPDYPQPIETTDQPVTITVKCGTEQQSITLTPPRPFTKWDKLEKVDGVWCWVYQHKVLTGAEMAKNVNAIHSSSALMVSTLELGITGEQNGAISNKFVCPVKSVSSLVHGEFRILQNNIYIKIDGVTTTEEGRQWLESNDITIIAQASTPESIPLPQSEQTQLNALTMYAGTTEVTNTGGCNMELTYTVDTKSYVDSKIAAISAAVLEV